MTEVTATPTIYEIKSCWTGRVLFSCELPADLPSGMAARHALEKATRERAVLRGADLRGAHLRGADLRGADLGDADLSDADLRGADLGGAHLRGADLRGADLRGAHLRGADLRGADLGDADLSDADLGGAHLRGADLRGADLSGADLGAANTAMFRTDVFDILLRAPHEVAGLRAALIAGRVDGSVYEGDCACLVGTIANIRGASYQELGAGIVPNAVRPAEQWFMNIKRGDTPESNQVSALTVGWIDEFTSLLEATRVTPGAA